MAALIITNGDAAGELLRRSFPGTEVLPWRDVLHEGPVPATATLSDLTEIRAAYLAGKGGDVGYVQNLLEARDRGLAHAAHFDRVILWFEHDLYDQLQLLQVLDWFAKHRHADLQLVQASDFLGRQTPEQLQTLAASARPVTKAQLVLAVAAWSAFRAETPEAWLALLEEDLEALPHLKAAVLRMLEELPGADGLSRSERQILAALRDGPLAPPPLFSAAQAKEEAAFIGDWSFWSLLDGLALAKVPLLQGLESAPFKPGDKEQNQAYFRSVLELTPFGAEVLGGADNAAANEIDRWWGGTHLKNKDLWRYDAAAKVVYRG